MATKATAAKKRYATVLDDLGGSVWLRDVGLRADDKAAVGIGGVLALRREVEKPKANRCLITRQKEKEGGYRLEYWRVDGEDGEATAEKLFHTAEDVKAELIAGFGATAPVIVMEW